MSRAPAYDCTRCGACCHNPDINHVLDYADYVEVRPTDTLLRKARLARRFVVTNAAGQSHMRLDRDQQHCAALRGTLGRSVECSIYEDRPEVCRLMEPGSDRCLAARREKGVDPA